MSDGYLICFDKCFSFYSTGTLISSSILDCTVIISIKLSVCYGCSAVQSRNRRLKTYKHFQEMHKI